MSQIQELLSVVVKNVPVEEMSEDVIQGWIENPKGLQNALRSVLIPPDTSAPKFEIWKEIELGLLEFQAPDDFFKDFDQNGDKISTGARDMMQNPEFTIADAPIKLPLIKVSVGDLGFTKWTRLDKIVAKAQKLGLDPCPEETGPQLRRQYRDQPLGEWLTVIMKPIADSDGFLRVVCVERDDDGRWLGNTYGDPGNEFSPGDRLLFVPRKVSS